MKYDPVAWEIAFKKSDLYKQLVNEYDVVYFDRPRFFSYQKPTPRQSHGEQEKVTFFSAIPFYYIEWLQEINPQKIYDLGCGWNIFKKYYPNIIGVGPNNKVDLGFGVNPHYFADIEDFVDDDYILGHQEYFECVFSICALHFIPLSDIRKLVLDFASMIKPGGRGWLSFNAIRLIERDPELKDRDMLFIEKYCKEKLGNLPDLVSLDIDVTYLNEYMDGNIHILFDKRRNQ